MNLDDFSYEENGRRYIDPNVSLNEQNAFVQNLRDTQAQRNAQIAQQTHNLGTDVPSHYGGLNGSEAYFNARYQTPQTNSLVANLKSAAQAQALNTALNNELQKAQKRYNDAYYAASARANGTSGSGGTTSGDSAKDRLGITTNGNNTGQQTIKQNDENKGGRGRLDFVTDTPKQSYEHKVTIYTDNNGNVYKVTRIPGGIFASTLPFTRDISPSTKNPETGQTFQSGDIFGYQGKKYLYLNNEQTGGRPMFYLVNNFEGRDDETPGWRDFN